jgi:hypothetical protein
MPAPVSATYCVEAKVAANTSFMNLIDTGTAGYVTIRDSSDVLLAQCPLDDPCGTVNGGTGQLVTSCRNACSRRRASKLSSCSSSWAMSMAARYSRTVARLSRMWFEVSGCRQEPRCATTTHT